MQKIFTLLLVAVVFVSVLGQVMAVPSYQLAQQTNLYAGLNVEGCHLVNRTDPIRADYGNVTKCHEIGHRHVIPQ